MTGNLNKVTGCNLSLTVFNVALFTCGMLLIQILMMQLNNVNRQQCRIVLFSGMLPVILILCQVLNLV